MKISQITNTNKNLKLAALVFGVMAALTPTAQAGSANANLDCKGPSDLVIRGNVPGDEPSEFAIDIQRGSKSVRLFAGLNQQTLTPEGNADIRVVESLKESVWTLSSRVTAPTSYGSLEMYALPKSVQFQNIPNGYKAKFDAKIWFNFSEIADETVRTKVVCTLKYEI